MLKARATIHSGWFRGMLAAAALWAVPGLAAEEDARGMAPGMGWVAELRAQEETLAELEARGGPFDPMLIEPLRAMIRLLQERGEHQRIAELQQRQLGLMRTNLGLESPRLIPLLREMVLTGIRIGEAEQVTDHLQLIRHLSAAEDDPESLLRAMDSLAHWHLTGGAADSSQRRARDFFKARELIEEAEDVALELHGEDNPAMAPRLYRGAMNLYQLVAVINTKAGLSGPALRELVRHDGAMKLQTSARGFSFNPIGATTVTPVVERGELVGELYLREAMGKIDDIGEIFASAGNPEAEAMALIYRADFQLLLGRGTAFSQYRDAIGLLLEAGVASDRVEHFFSRPQLLPVDRFHPTLEAAIADQEAELAAWRQQGGEAAHVPPFTAWDQSAPNMRAPVSANAFWELPANQHAVELEFNISSRGGVSSVNIVAAEPDDRRSRRLARDAARQLRFRPPLEEGRGQRLRDVRMQFLLPRRED